MKIIFMQMAGMSTVYGINSLVSTVDLKLNSPFVRQKSFKPMVVCKEKLAVYQPDLNS